MQMSPLHTGATRGKKEQGRGKKNNGKTEVDEQRTRTEKRGKEKNRMKEKVGSNRRGRRV